MGNTFMNGVNEYKRLKGTDTRNVLLGNRQVENYFGDRCLSMRIILKTELRALVCDLLNSSGQSKDRVQWQKLLMAVMIHRVP